MKKLLFAVLAVVATSYSASAADMPVKAPAPIMVAPYNWTGFYVGISGGAGWGQSHHSVVGLTDFSDTFNVSGGIIGGTAGYNWQTGALVLGVEGDASYASLSGSTMGVPPMFCPDGSPASNCTTKLRGLETLRLRVGYAWDRFMPYVTGGLAVGDTAVDAYKKALACDPVSAFGSVIAFNVPVDDATADVVSSLFVECIVAPKLSAGAVEILRRDEAGRSQPK